MFTEERRKEILSYIRSNGRVTVEELCDLFEVSHATIRKDLNELDSSGAIKRTHGGAVAKQQVDYEANFAEKNEQQLEEKQYIAREALKYIKEGDCIALDSGTTTYELAKLIGSFKRLRVVTHDLMIASYLDANTDISLFVIGGEVRKKQHYMMGNQMMDMLENLNVDTFFISTNGIDPERGLTTAQLETAIIKRTILKNSRERILLTDSSKFDRIFFSRFAEITDIDRIVTDEGITEKQYDALCSKNIDVVICKKQL